MTEPDGGPDGGNLEAALGLLETVLAGTSDGYWRIDADGRLMDVNPAYCRMSGYSREELVGRSIQDLDPAADISEIRQRIARITDSGSARFRARHRAKDGHHFDVEIHAIRLSHGGHSIGFIQDVTALAQREEQLKQSEAQLRNQLDGAPLGIAISRLGRIVYVNEHYLRTHGFERAEDLIGTSIFDRVSEEDLQSFSIFPDLLALGEAAYPTFELRSLRKDRSAFWVSASVRTLALSDGPAVIGFIQDISERKHAEQERETLIGDLQDALAQVHTLSGLLPICSHCKKIRDDRGYWNQLEAYITHHSKAIFSHGICPDCARAYYPEFADGLGRRQREG